MNTFATAPMWAGFLVLVLGTLVVDIFVLGGRRAHRVSTREALGWTLTWSSLALLFGIALWWLLAGSASRETADRKVLEFYTGYLIELSLSVDNMFVFAMIFGYFAVPPELQRRVLLFGVVGAIVMRAAMILAGVWLISEFSWILYVFGVFLLFTGVKMLFVSRRAPDLSRNPIVRFLCAHMRITADYHGERFFVRMDGLHYATPMFLVVLLVEATDLVFAVDSIPAIFAVTTDPFIVFTSNIFAIMGLRALYFLLANLAQHFQHLKYGLAIVLAFIGAKMLAEPWFHVPVHWSLGAVAMTLLVSVLVSQARARRTLAHAGDELGSHCASRERRAGNRRT
ncbi:TerC family protein [Cupriavidus sp. BIC8F]|uniref:TerC family protein n=1 Tax=Cupriavidus sp. BIC8F TaxID=3079014 RepID=UPI002916B200|nr:TerC family protein [Cupriavidus sp. BIC8F]